MKQHEGANAVTGSVEPSEVVEVRNSRQAVVSVLKGPQGPVHSHIQSLKLELCVRPGANVFNVHHAFG